MNLINLRPGPGGLAAGLSSGRFNSYIGAHTDRRRRHDLRTRRRDGDLFILDVPPVLLWLEDGYVPALEDVFEPVLPLDDLWP